MTWVLGATYTHYDKLVEDLKEGVCVETGLDCVPAPVLCLSAKETFFSLGFGWRCSKVPA